MRNRVIGNGGLLLAIILACAMSAVEFFLGNPQYLEGELGICLPSPNLWNFPPVFSWLLNLSLIIILGLALHIFNKTYNFVSGSDTVVSAAFIFLCGANPWIDSILTSSVIMMGINLMCLSLLFSRYRSHDAMQEIFIAGTLLSICSMFQYAFIFMLPAYIIIAFMLKCMNLRSFIALVLGVAAPYWIVIGMGLIPLDAFSMPTFTNLFTGFESREILFVGILECAITIALSLMLTLYNAVRLYAGNTRRRHFNNAIIILGIIATVALAFDADNMPVYMATIYMVLAVQLGNLFALRQVRHAPLIFVIIALLYLAAFVLMETGFNFAS